MIHIDVFIPFYTYFTDQHRYNWTRVIFKHMATIAGQLSHRAHFTFTLLGSEGERSRKLALEFMDPRNYYDFDQAAPQFGGVFERMFDCKIKTGMEIASKKGPDIILWMGSNDYIPQKFFNDIIDFYYENHGQTQGQMYGIDNYQNGQNAVFFSMFDGTNNKLDIHNNAFWWDGRSPYPRHKYDYSAGIIGLNKTAYQKYPDLIEKWNFDEGIDEEMMKAKKNILKFNSKRNFYINVKMQSGNELNTFQSLRGYFAKNILHFQNFDISFQNYVNNEIFYLDSLMKSTL